MVNLIWALAFIPLAWYLTLLLHETAHALVAVLQGNKVTEFAPYWHWYDAVKKKVYFWWGKGRKFYFGRISVSDGTPTYKEKFHRALAPFWKTILFTLIWGGILIGTGWWPILTFLACELVDHFWFWRGWIWKCKDTDGFVCRGIAEKFTLSYLFSRSK